MSELTRRVNRLLGQTLRVQVVPGNTRPVRLDTRWFTHVSYFAELLAKVSTLGGDLVECGVADGVSLSMISSLNRAISPLEDRTIWGFDAWAGLPSPTEADLTHEKSIATAGMFGYTSIRRVREELMGYGWAEADIDKTIKLIPGYFEQTLPGFQSDIALLHIDADLYDSYRCALVNLWPKVRTGGIVAFDEYEDTEKWPGARRAVDEFLGTLAPGVATLHEHRCGKWWVSKQVS